MPVHQLSLNRSFSLRGNLNIENLFKLGSQTFSYPFKAIFRFLPASQPAQNTKFAISIAKKRIKKATDRNLTRRRSREAFRLNKSILSASLSPEHQTHILLIYVANTPLIFSKINSAIQEILSSINLNYNSYAQTLSSTAN